MQRPRPWLLIAAVVIIATLIAYVAGLEPPDDTEVPPTTATGAVWEPVQLDRVSDPVALDFTWTHENTGENVTRVRAMGIIEFTGVRGDGEILFRLRITTPGARHTTPAFPAYSCTEPTPFVIVDNACARRNLQTTIPFLDDWRIGTPPDERPDNATAQEGQAHVGIWTLELLGEIERDASYDLIAAELTFFKERYWSRT